jgi:hypothetical protein
MTTFVFRLKAPRATFALDMSDDEREIMVRHAEYWRPWIESGQMVIFGPVLDSGGSRQAPFDQRTELLRHPGQVRRGIDHPEGKRDGRAGAERALAAGRERQHGVEAEHVARRCPRPPTGAVNIPLTRLAVRRPLARIWPGVDRQRSRQLTTPKRGSCAGVHQRCRHPSARQ